MRESAQALALAPLPDDAGICRAEAEDLLFARDRITCALADRVGRVHGAGQAKRHGHASTRSWLRTAAGMSVAGAGRLLTLAVELARLPRVREKFAEGGLAAGVVEAICTATAQLSDEHAGLAEPILLELAGKAGAAEVAKAGRYLRAVLDPDGEDRDEQADYARRFLRVRPTRGGGLEGEFHLPREAAARLRALLDAYAKPRAEGDDRPLRVRNADAFIALLEQKIATELLVLVNAESLPADPEAAAPQPAASQPADPGTDHSDHPEDITETDTSDTRSGDTSDHAPIDADTPGAFSEMGGLADAGSADDAAPAQDESPCRPADRGPVEAGADAGAGSDAGADAAADSAAGSSDHATTGPRDEEARDPAPGEHGNGKHGNGKHGNGKQRTGEHDTASAASAEADDTAPTASGECDRGEAHAGATRARRAAAWPACGGSAPPHTAPPHAARLPDPPPEHAAAHHAHAGHRPAGDCRHGQTTREGHGHEHRGHGEGGCGCDNTARCSCAAPGWPPGAVPGTALGSLSGTVPGLLLATGQVLPVSSVHRLARTSTLVRLVMDAEGQVLDMGRKVRLATPAQRRAIFTRYATCWIDGCPLPATMCQIDHADNWSTGGLTDLKLLGPACQFHNRDRYRHPDRYTRHKIGTDRWAFTYRSRFTPFRPRK
ncbi:HNH endonuclease signature motif containing protein [Microbispora sp. KK1-11]|uniref:HNH endonuclease signature motif containing protein n=1 Tax=Microbispora sp. KK1-11 TaxID=2053005 RepID=UPI00163BD509|nr:HNH endonuclease signature motif containing protein [Microbispora sp. KK1-11]